MEENPRPRRPRQRPIDIDPKEYQERVNPLEFFNEKKFVRRYRLDKEAVRQLAVLYAESGCCSTLGMPNGGGTGYELRVCVALRYLATGSGYTLIGDFHGVSDATVSRCVKEVCECLYQNQQLFIHFPVTFEECRAKAQRFYAKKKKPFCIGLIDGTHIPILSPTINEGAFMNRKRYHSLNVMIACDADREITYVDARFAGSVNDAFIFRQSEIHDLAEQHHFGDFFILGDSGFALENYLLTPILRPDSPADHRYNKWHKSTRSEVEGAIGVLKQRFRALDDSGGYLYHSPCVAAKIVVACVCLNNIAIRRRLPVPPPEADDDPDAFRPPRRPREQPRGRMAGALQAEIDGLGLGNARRNQFIARHCQYSDSESDD